MGKDRTIERERERKCRIIKSDREERWNNEERDRMIGTKRWTEKK
jgi:hypothetical protein